MSPRRSRPRVVTLGGGHGQAALLSALRDLSVDVSAVVTVADDGGCSGELRSAAGMPPPGDLRRCLSALATNRSLAERFERRLSLGKGKRRSAGNLVLALARARLGSMQAASDWAATLLRARGRVLPVSESPGLLVVCDAHGHVVSGESVVGEASKRPLVAGVHGVGTPNPDALAAIEAADMLLFGPGSFFTSTLAVVTAAGVARACVRSPSLARFATK